MENVADGDAAWLDARIRATWGALVFEFPRPGNPDPERYEAARLLVSRDEARAEFRGHTFLIPLDAAAAKIYRQMDRSMLYVHFRDRATRLARLVARKCEQLVADDEAALVVAPALAFDGPLGHWLPRETIRDSADEARMARALMQPSAQWSWPAECSTLHSGTS